MKKTFHTPLLIFPTTVFEQKEVMQDLTDEEIAEKCKNNKEYFINLVERYQTKIRIYVRRITGIRPEIAEDITQEVFIKVYSNIEKFNSHKKFSSWIYRIAHNQAVNLFLYEKRRGVENLIYSEKGEPLTVISDHRDFWIDLQQQNINQQLFEALEKIPQKYREVIMLSYYGDKSYKDISVKLHKPVNTIGTMLNRGKKMLKRELLKMGVSRDVALVKLEENFRFKI